MNHCIHSIVPLDDPGAFHGHKGRPLPGEPIETPQPPTLKDLADVVGLLKLKLAWFGFQRVRIGPFVKVTDGVVHIDLLDDDEAICRIELDSRRGSIKFPSGYASHSLIASLRKYFDDRQAR